MKQQFEVRTDLAVEEKESFPGDGGEIRGVSLREWSCRDTELKLTEVVILDERGAKSMGKPIGTYITLEAGSLKYKDEDYHNEVSEELSKQLKQLIDKNLTRSGKGKTQEKLSALVVGLGNPSVTPDSLGPRVLGNLQMSRHLHKAYSESLQPDMKHTELSGIVPGVMAQTGMETSEILTGIIEVTQPDMLIVIDALAARSVTRLGTTIQLTDTGIHPGSGVGNHRNGLTEESLGIPVLAIGVPTVVGAAAIVHDTVGAMIKMLQQMDSTKDAGGYVEGLPPGEQYELIRELLEPEFGPMYVTPPDIDETIKQLSFTISEGIHMAVY